MFQNINVLHFPIVSYVPMWLICFMRENQTPRIKTLFPLFRIFGKSDFSSNNNRIIYWSDYLYLKQKDIFI